MTAPIPATGLVYFFTAQTTDANSSSYIINYSSKTATVSAFGTWNGASVKIQSLAPDNTTWLDIPDLANNTTSFTANGQKTVINFPQGKQMRAVQSSSGGSTSLTVTLEKV